MRSNRLQPNPDKTEVLWCATTRRQHQLPTLPLLIDDYCVSPVRCARDLGIYTDCNLSMLTLIKRTLFCVFSQYSIDFQADYITVVEDRPITVKLLHVMTLEQSLSVLYCQKFSNIVLLNDIRVFWSARIISLVLKKELAAVMLSKRYAA